MRDGDVERERKERMAREGGSRGKERKERGERWGGEERGEI